jgi:hypothetical protein
MTAETWLEGELVELLLPRDGMLVSEFFLVDAGVAAVRPRGVCSVCTRAGDD